MSESTEETKKPTGSVGDTEESRWRGGKGIASRVEERVNAAYAAILDGGTRREACDKLSLRFNVSHRTAQEDYKKAMVLLREEQTATREDLLNQIQALRLTTVKRCLKARNYQTAAQLLADMGKVIGEAAPETLAVAVPELSVRIADKAN